METRGRKTVSAERAELLRQIPSVDELLLQPRLAALSKRADRNLVVEVTRAALADLRARIAGDSNWTAISVDSASVEELISDQVEKILSRSLQAVINATGVILHTNLAARRCRKQPWTNSGARRRNIRTWNTIWKRVRGGSGM